MDTLEELKYYCDEPQPVGALMLTGEWGCGKTYLLNNSLSNVLKDKCVFLRVSLFGMASIEEVKKEVKQCWLRTVAELNTPASGWVEKAQKYTGVFKTVADKGAEHLPEPWKSIVSGALSFNVIDFVKVEPKMGDKKVILIFDDLERTDIPTSDLLGCINDYCENLHINTIVVANEEKIQSSEKDKIKYSEIKEKIIQRTIHYVPDYSSVVSNVIDSIECKDDVVSQEYKALLVKYKEIISSIFSGASVEGIPLEQLISKKYSGNSRAELESEKEKIQKLLKHRPHNIRSLKCAIQDFKRIYILLNEKHIDNREKWLFTYLSYVLCFRAGLIPESAQYGTLFSDEKVSILYPGFYDDKFITGGIKQWIRHGEWAKDTLDAEFDYVINRGKAITPEEKVRMNRLLDLDEVDIRDGYPILLEEAYTGTLELNDYVNLLYNSCWARKYNIQLPDIKWEKISDGIHKQIEKMIHSGEEQPRHCMIIGDDNKDLFLPEEWNAYKIINDFLSSNTLMFEKNKALYVNLMKKEPLNALAQTQNKRFDMFDVEMAEATADGFEKVTNAEKSSFVDYFKRMWQVNICTQDYKIKLPEEGFQTLKRRILQILDKCRVESLPISEAHANSFLEVIDNLIVEQKQKLQEIQNKEEEDRIKAEEKALAEKQEAEQAKKSEIDDVVEKMLSDGVSADDILAKLK